MHRRRTSWEIIIYNIPAFTGIKLNADTVIKISNLDKRVVAYKDSSGLYAEFMRVLSTFENTGFSVMQGVTGQALSAVLMGADGFVPALAPAFPEMFVDAYNTAREVDRDLIQC